MTQFETERTPCCAPLKLAQFEPRRGYDNLYSIDLQTGEFRRFSLDREHEIERTMSEFIAPHVRQTIWLGKPCTVERFIDNVKETIARYESTRTRESGFDRKRARLLLTQAYSATEETIKGLNAIHDWPELDEYLLRVFVDSLGLPVFGELDVAKLTLGHLEIRLKREAAFRSFGPAESALLLARLSAVLKLAAERVVLQPGEYQLDRIAHDFADEMLFAWQSATGTLPVAAKANRATARRSPFIQLLSVANSLIDAPYRHPTEFREYGIKAVARERRKEAKR